MPLLVQPVISEDFPRAFEIWSIAFGRRQPFLNEFFPNHDTLNGRMEGARRLEAMAADLCTTMLKVVDTDMSDEDHPAGLIIGMAKWNIYKDRLPMPTDLMEGTWWDDGKGDKVYAELIANAFFERRAKAISASGGNLAGRSDKYTIQYAADVDTVLDVLAVDPAHQGKGVGALLVKWGMDKADELDLAVSQQR